MRINAPLLNRYVLIFANIFACIAIFLLSWLQFVGSQVGLGWFYHSPWKGLICYPNDCLNPLYWRTTSADHVLSVLVLLSIFAIITYKTHSPLWGLSAFLLTFAVGEFYADALIVQQFGLFNALPMLGIVPIVWLYKDFGGFLKRFALFAIAALPMYLIWLSIFNRTLDFVNFGQIVWLNASSNFTNGWEILVWIVNCVLFYFIVGRHMSN